VPSWRRPASAPRLPRAPRPLRVATGAEQQGSHLGQQLLNGAPLLDTFSDEDVEPPSPHLLHPPTAHMLAADADATAEAGDAAAAAAEAAELPPPVPTDVLLEFEQKLEAGEQLRCAGTALWSGVGARVSWASPRLQGRWLAQLLGARPCLRAWQVSAPAANTSLLRRPGARSQLC
jgi:hypothetical protein